MLPVSYISNERRTKSTTSAKTKSKPRSSRSLCQPTASLGAVSTDTLSALLTESSSSSETNSFSAHNVEPTRSSSIPGHSQQGGLAAPSPSSAFYDTDGNNPQSSSQTSSSTGATRGANSSEEELRDANSPLNSMSPSRGESSSNPNPARPPNQDTRTYDSTRSNPQRPSARHSTSAPVQPSFARHSFPSHSFYPPHSNQEAFSPASSYPPPPHGPPSSGYLRQYTTSQSPHSLPMQPSMGYYSQAFTLPGIHAHDPSAVPIPFPPPPLTRGYTYAAPSESEPPPQRAFPPPLPPHPPLHFSHAPSPTHYAYPPPHSYAHSSPTIYSFSPNPYSPSFYSQHPPSQEDTSKGGTWYYVPPSRGTQYDASAYPGLYTVQGYQAPVQMSPGDFEHSYPLASSGTVPPQSGQESLPSSQLQTQESAIPPPSSPALRHNPTSFTPVSSNPASSSHSNHSPKKKPITDSMPSSPPATSRKSYHPAPPVNRSDWVMWVGNVPSDATHDEVWRFFNQPSPPPFPESTSAVLSSRLVQPSSGSSSQDEKWGGVSSVFLISRSNCAFVNFETKSHLDSAVIHFNGKPLRPLDPKCPRLVCRVRRKEDDLEAGVGAQRHRGLHTRWVTEQLELERKNRGKGDAGFFIDAPPTSPSSSYLAASSSSDPSPPIHAMSHIDEPHTPITPLRDLSLQDDKAKAQTGSLGARSFSSTNSSLLREYFPKRYFILKSLTPYDLDLSIRTGVWATQPHNEGTLDQAYRTSKDVYLIFSANRSGEFFGYARMTGPIFPRKEHDDAGVPNPPKQDDVDALLGRFLTPNESQPLFESPMATPAQHPQLAIDVRSSRDAPVQGVATAPAEPHQPHRRLSRPSLMRAVGTYPDEGGEIQHVQVQTSLDPLRTHAPVKDIKLDGQVILEKPAPRPHNMLAHTTSGVINKLETVESIQMTTYGGGVAEDIEKAEQEFHEGEEKPESVGRGREFKIEWIRTEKLPFTRTKHLRNPWNHGREVKVSRDGTEIEPKVGQGLLDEWDKPVQPEPSTASPPTSPVRSRPMRTAGGGGGGAVLSSSSTPATTSYFPTSRHNRPRPTPERHRPE